MIMNLFTMMSEKTKIMAAGATVLTVATIISYRFDKKKAKADEENEYLEEDVFDPILDDEDEA